MRSSAPRIASVAVLAAVLAFAAASCGDDGAPGGGSKGTSAAADGPVLLPGTTPHQAGVRVGGEGGLVTRGVGSECATCHADVAERYRSSGMSDAMTLPSGEGSIEASLVGKSCVDPETGITIRFAARDGRYVQRIVYVDAAGVERGSYEFPVDLVVGSGHATRTYLAVRDGRFVELPATWYRETGALALSPGGYFRGASGARVEHRCIECHAGDVTPHADGAPGRFAGEISLGITCRRCHGDAPEHVRTGATADVVNPVDLAAERQEDLCAQCHLSAAVGVQTPGTSLARDYRAGTPLGQFLGVFADAEVRDDAPETAIASHGARMRLSRCATASRRDGIPPLACTTCHDPHEGHRLSAAERRLDHGCSSCHDAESCTLPHAERADRSCSSCHMATYPSSDIAHTRTTDHFIRRRPPVSAGAARRPEETFIGALAAADRPLRNLLDPEGRLPGAELLRALAYEHGIVMSASVLGRPAAGYAARLSETVDRLARAAPDDPVLGVLLATARRQSGDAADAVRILLDHERRFGRRPRARLLLAFAQRELRRPADVAESARLALEDDPYEESAACLLAEALVGLGRPAEAVTVLAGIRERIGPSAGRASQAMAAASAARDAARAVEAGYDVLMFHSRDPRALADVAHVVAFEAGDAAQGRVLFGDALARDANCVPALVGLARVEDAAGDTARARDLATRAERLAPGIPEVQAILERRRGR